MEIRAFTDTDSEGVTDLWRRAGLVHPMNDPRRDIERKMSDSPWGFLVAVDDAAIVGSVMVGYEGHRGWINYLACHPNRRRTGIATELMTAARELLLDRGCPKINLQVRAGNQEVRKFYESLGYSEDSVTSFGLRLIPDS
jgi:ribosomal protein S18 acetylase RimI-like enzyme